ncbi:MAG: radical SAM family heme chaperone HemW [Anaerolineae bacterium]
MVGIYVHIPFCLRRCTYCDFNTYTGLLSLEGEYVVALLEEARLWAERTVNVEAETLYFGGGTPSLLETEEIARVVEAVRQHFGLRWGAEISLEANPGTVDRPSLMGMREAGVTRLSLGVQSSHSRELLLLGRTHTWSDAVKSYRLAREAGFESVNLDLMYGLPDQSLEDWMATVERCLALGPDHLSLYALTLEPGTPLAEALALNDVPMPDSDLAADMYDAASEALHAAGFWQYEISNWARGTVPAPGIWALPPDGVTERIGPHVCAHNLIYWRNRPWIGLGAGAHSWFRGRRWRNFPHPRGYINAIKEGRLGDYSDEALPQEVAYGETMMMGLRLAEGVTDARFYNTYGLHLLDLYGPVIEQLSSVGLVVWADERLRLSEHGRLLGNLVFQEFLMGDEDQPRFSR